MATKMVIVFICSCHLYMPCKSTLSLVSMLTSHGKNQPQHVCTYTVGDGPARLLQLPCLTAPVVHMCTMTCARDIPCPVHVIFCALCTWYSVPCARDIPCPVHVILLASFPAPSPAFHRLQYMGEPGNEPNILWPEHILMTVKCKQMLILVFPHE